MPSIFSRGDSEFLLESMCKVTVTRETNVDADLLDPQKSRFEEKLTFFQTQIVQISHRSGADIKPEKSLKMWR